jgi:hypothetical protein
MSGGGDSTPPTQQVNSTTTTNNLPEYARPYFENILNRAQAESYRPYTPYEGQRIAGFTPDQQALQTEVRNMQTPGQFGAASDLAYGAGLSAANAGQYAPTAVINQQVQMPFLERYGMQGAEQFGNQQAQQYMSPYIQNVVDVQKREAVRDAQKSQLAQDLGAARQGTYGGARQLLAATERERALGQQMGDIQARGLQSSYENAQAQFERDRSAGFNVGQQNLQAAMQRQQLGTQTGLQAALANQSSNLDAQRLAEQSRQFGSQQGLAGNAQAIEAGRTLGNLGLTQQQADMQRLGLQGASADQYQQMRQRQYDTAYSDFLRQRDYPMELLGQYSNLLRGIPVGLNTTGTTYAPPPSMLAQMGGVGLGAASLARLSGT